MKVLLLAGCYAVACATGALAQSKGMVESKDPVTLDEVSKSTNDGEHVLWIFGTLSPMPIGIKWRSRQVEKIVAESQEIVLPDSVAIAFEERVGIFKAITLIPSVLRARKNPDDKHLQDLVPADIYARWLVQKAMYIGKDAEVEKWRPTFAAQELRDKALAKLKAVLSGGAWRTIGPIAKERKIKISTPSVIAKIPNKQIRASIKEFSKKPLSDIECFAATLAGVEALSDDKAINARANAWAQSDLTALRQLPPFPDAGTPCEAALLESQVVQDFHFEGFDNLKAARVQRWMEVIEKALTSNQSTLVLLPIDELSNLDGRLNLLRAKGYKVQEPI